MTNKDIIEQIKAIKASQISFVKLGFTDIDGVLRGKLINTDKFLNTLDKGLGFCDVVFGWDSEDQLYNESKVTGWHTGFPDAKLNIDIGTFRRVPWENNIPFFLADFSLSSHPACPRTLLKNVIKKADDLGLEIKIGSEFEWFNFKKADNTQVPPLSFPETLTTGMFGYSLLRLAENSEYVMDLMQLLEKFNVPLEGFHTETGPGVYEACLSHGAVLSSADKAVLFKQGVKEIALKHNILASFMAKWNDDLPGCSGHIHQSVWKKDKNLFQDTSKVDGLSDLLKHFIAGQLTCLPEIMPMFAPTVNSYKRLVKGAWAPTHVSWGIDNRTTAVRVIKGDASSTRIETRTPGSDINPYLAIAAAIASGLYGIENKLTLDNPSIFGNAYEKEGLKRLPTNLLEATQAMESSSLAKTLFGADFVNHFVMTRMWEWKQFESKVTNWELNRYLETI